MGAAFFLYQHQNNPLRSLVVCGYKTLNHTTGTDMRQMVITVLASFLLANGAPEENIIGVWETQKGDSKIEIYRTPDGTFSGKIIWAQAPHESYVGTTVMKGVEYKDGTYTCPWIYDPRMGITAHAKITLSGDTMNVRATKGIISKQEVFIRNNEMAAGE